MASYVWEGRNGNAAATAQVGTIQITGYDATTTYKLTIGGHVISHVGATSPADAIGKAAALKALWDASGHPYISGAITCVAGGTDTLTFTASIAGVPFTIVPSVSGGAGTIGSYSATTASAGPADASTAANWVNMSTGERALPTSGDHIYFMDSDRHCLFGLDTFASTNLIVTQDASFTGYIGLNPEEFTSNISSNAITVVEGYREYKPQYFGFIANGTTPSVLGRESGLGPFLHSGRLKFDLANGSDTVLVNATRDTSDDTGKMPLRLRTSASTLSLDIASGNVGINSDWDDAATTAFASVNIHAAPSGKNTPTVHFGGTSDGTSINVLSGNHVFACGGTVDELNTRNCTVTIVEHPAAGKLTTVRIGDGASVDFNHCYMTTGQTIQFYARGSAALNAENLISPTFAISGYGLSRDDIILQRQTFGAIGPDF